MSRGDVHALRTPVDARGHEQRGRRFAVIVQAVELATLSTVIIAPTSISAKRAWFRPEVVIRERKTLVLVDQLRAVDYGRLGLVQDRLDVAELGDIDHVLGLLLGLKWG